MTKPYLSTFCMNAGEQYNDILIRNIAEYSKHFQKVFICDGNLTEKAKAFYDQLPMNVVVIDYPWDDRYVERYKRNASMVPQGQWILHLDSDEVPSQSLLDFLQSEKYERLKGDFNMLCLPCVLFLTDDDGKSFVRCQDWPEQQFKGQWTKNILYRNDSDLMFKFQASHVVPTHGNKEKGCYIPCPYIHLKSLESFAYNDVVQAFLSPEGQHYSLQDARMFRMFSQSFKTMKEFKQAIKNNSWPPTLKKFAWERRHHNTNPVSRLAWTYFLLEGNPMPEQDDDMTWENKKQYVLSRKELDYFDRMKLSSNVNDYIMVNV